MAGPEAGAAVTAKSMAEGGLLTSTLAFEHGEAAPAREKALAKKEARADREAKKAKDKAEAKDAAKRKKRERGNE